MRVRYVGPQNNHGPSGCDSGIHSSCDIRRKDRANDDDITTSGAAAVADMCQGCFVHSTKYEIVLSFEV